MTWSRSPPTLNSPWVNLTQRGFPPHSRQEDDGSPHKDVAPDISQGALELMFPLVITMGAFRSRESHAASSRSPLSLQWGLLESRSEVTTAPQTHLGGDNEEGVMREMLLFSPRPAMFSVDPFTLWVREERFLLRRRICCHCDLRGPFIRM